MYHLFIAGLGGFVGTMMRYLLNNVIYGFFDFPTFPYGTLTINISGCFFIGLIASLAESRLSLSPEVRIFIQIGILGGFTTFSTFGYETFTLIRDGQFFLGLGNIVLQVFVGLFAVWAGYYLGQLSG